MSDHPAAAQGLAAVPQGGEVPASPEQPTRHPVLLGLGLMLIAFNLRPALSSVGPLLPQIRAEAGLSPFGAGLLTTLPVLALGVFGPLGPRVAGRIGADRATLAFLLVLAAGLALRGVGTLPALFLGSVVAAAGIGVVGVLLPGLVKRDFPDRVGSMTGLYTTVLCLGAAFGAGASVPFARVTGAGFSGALMAWAAPALAAALVWALLARGARTGTAVVRPAPGLWRDPLAWRVTGFMGLQSSLAYVVFGWFAAALQERGLSAVDAGFVTSVSVAAQAITALAVPTLAARTRDQRGFAAAVALTPPMAFAVALFGPPGLLWPSAIVLGLGLGGCIGLALTLIVLRAPDAHTAARLSAMAQGVGYCLASLGPLAIGIARQATGGWGVALVVYAGLALAALACGLGAGRDRQVLTPGPARG